MRSLLRKRSFWIQVLFGAALIAVLGLLINNLTVNLLRMDLGLSFGWLARPAGFPLAETAFPYSPSDSYAWALVVGWFNSLKVIVAGLVLATLLLGRYLEHTRREALQRRFSHLSTEHTSSSITHVCSMVPRRCHWRFDGHRPEGCPAERYSPI